MPFLGPTIAAWITFSVLVMAAYFVLIAPKIGRKDTPPPAMPAADEPVPSLSPPPVPAAEVPTWVPSSRPAARTRFVFRDIAGFPASLADPWPIDALVPAEAHHDA